MSYAYAYEALAVELEAMASFVRHSTATARNEAGREALTTYALAQRLANSPPRPISPRTSPTYATPSASAWEDQSDAGPVADSPRSRSAPGDNAAAKAVTAVVQ